MDQDGSLVEELPEVANAATEAQPIKRQLSSVI